MAGGYFLGRAFSYVLNEIIVEGLANNHAFQRFAVRTSKAIGQVSSKLEQAKQEVVEHVRDLGNNSTNNPRP